MIEVNSTLMNGSYLWGDSASATLQEQLQLQVTCAFGHRDNVAWSICFGVALWWFCGEYFVRQSKILHKQKLSLFYRNISLRIKKILHQLVEICLWEVFILCSVKEGRKRTFFSFIQSDNESTTFLVMEYRKLSCLGKKTLGSMIKSSNMQLWWDTAYKKSLMQISKRKTNFLLDSAHMKTIVTPPF